MATKKLTLNELRSLVKQIIKEETMKNFDDKEEQIKEICDNIRTADRLDKLDLQLKIAFYDILKLVREAYYEGHDAGVQTMTDIQLKNQEKINSLFK